MPAQPGGQPDGGTSAGGEPPRWWTVLVPCLLTLPVAGWSVLLAAIAGALGCFDTCMPGNGVINAAAVAEVVLAGAAFALAVAGLAMPARRRVLRRASWIACLLAYVTLGALYAWIAANP